MKTKKTAIVSFALAILFLLGAGLEEASAITVTVNNKTGQPMKLVLYVTSQWTPDWREMFSNAQSVAAGGTYTFNVPLDSKGACPADLSGYNADLSRSIAFMHCDGNEGNATDAVTRCCVNSVFELYRKDDGSFHYRKIQ